MNATITRFGYPASLVADYEHWVVLLRPQQATLGALVLAARSDAHAFGDLGVEATAEIARVTRDIETTLAAIFSYDKINYLMLMMVDPHVHFHVLPRYADERQHDGARFVDPGWPGPPRLDLENETTPDSRDRLRQQLLAAWPEVGR